MHPDDWVIDTFAVERAVGKMRSPSTDSEVAFSFEAWWPCEPAMAQAAQDSDQRRHLLLPQPGEPVAVEWKTSWRGDEIPSRVRRQRPLVTILPRMPFAEWLQQMGQHIPALSGLGADEWSRLFPRLDDDIDDSVFSAEPGDPEQHLGLLAWLVEHAPADFVALRLPWLANTASSGATALESRGEASRAFALVSPQVLERLVADQLVIVDSRSS